MKVVSKDFHLVSNVELAQVLVDRGSDSRGDVANGSVAERKVHAYLSQIPTADVDSSALQGFIEATKSYKLSRKELLQFINLRPSQQVECYLIIEDLEERYNEDQIEELLQKVQEHLGPAA